ncbi:unknown [Alistipes sp. CAG:514]|nr:unknown [Alistipes sp. CAG:514]
MRRAEDRLLGRLCHHLGGGQFKIVVGMLKIADSVLSLGDVDGSVRHHLDVLSVKYAVILPGDHVGDPGLSRVEIVADLLHAESLLALRHLRLPLPLAGKAVVSTSGIDRPRGHVIFHVVCLQLDVLIGDFNLAPVVHLALAVGEILPDGILRSRESRPGERTLLQK